MNDDFTVQDCIFGGENWGKPYMKRPHVSPFELDAAWVPSTPNVYVTGLQKKEGSSAVVWAPTARLLNILALTYRTLSGVLLDLYSYIP